MKHTPGPWVLNDARSSRVDLIDTTSGRAVGEIVWVDTRNPADARLIASAPDMLDTLRDIVRMLTDANDMRPSALRVAREAIARATGGQL